MGAQEVATDHNKDYNAAFQEKIEERLLTAEQRAQEQTELNLERLETVEERVKSIDRHISQVLLIFGLSALMVFFLMMGSLRSHKRLSVEQVSRTVHDADRLMNDIRRELARPEMKHLRTGHMLREMMRRLREGKYDISAEELAMVRTVCEDGRLSVSLYFMARVLIMECEQRWHEAVQILDELRLMVPDDIDVLLHLSHVHGNLAEIITDAKESKRNQVKARQYYAHFAMMVQSERYSTPAKQIKKIPISSPLTENIKSSPKKTLSSPEGLVSSPKQPVSSPEEVAKLPNQPTATPLNKKLEPNISLPSLKLSISKKGGLMKLAGGVSKKISTGATSSVYGLGEMLHMLSRDENTTLPLVPSPPVSKIPTNVTESETMMWQDIRKGDLCMSQATNAKTMRERNRLIDAAIVHYAQGQAHETNETLYQNWGQALLAKALHLPEKKRPPMFSAAVDKFMAGNVVKKNYFDFSLASLYAIMNNAEECKKWLEISLNSNTLDMDSLRHAPDFDSVRGNAWFAEFIRE